MSRREIDLSSVDARPETKFVMSGETSIAYQVFGRGDQDLLYVPGIISHLEAQWDDPEAKGFLLDLSRHYRVIMIDKRGQGMSDRIDGATTLEERIDDLRAVMEATASTVVNIFAISEGGPVSLLFAATYPERVKRLILFGAMAKFWGSADYPYMAPIESMQQSIDTIASNWGRGHFAERAGPIPTEAFRRPMLARLERMACSPAAIRKFLAANSLIDVRPILPEIRQECLVIQRRHDRMVGCGNGRYLADRIVQATYLELPGTAHLPQYDDWSAIIAASVQFTGQAKDQSSKTQALDRKLCTALFTDMVGSTRHLAEIGDHAWRSMLDQHDAIVMPLVLSHHGRVIKHTGDGVLAIFDGPVRALQCALTMVEQLKTIKLSIRAGLHVGEVVFRGDDVTGIAVNIAARVMDQAESGEVLMTKTTKDLTGGSQMRFESVGDRVLKGLKEPYELFRHCGAD
jgi:class 3 adenylate cyclase/pimeloyl-ACP methyl ester carboxylesterase